MVWRSSPRPPTLVWCPQPSKATASSHSRVKKQVQKVRRRTCTAAAHRPAARHHPPLGWVWVVSPQSPRVHGRSTLHAPCTNRPVACSICNLTVWSYSMEQHFEEKHPGMSMPPELKDAVTLAYHERAHLEQLLTKLKAKNLCKGLGCECKL